MTKPTGRPRGRPKTKEYVTLMARVPEELAERAKRYAALHQQNISVVLRDGLELLLEEDRYRPFLSDTNTARNILSDTNTDDTTILSDTNTERPSILSDRKEATGRIVSDTNTEVPGSHAGMPAPARSVKVSDRKEEKPAILSDTKADAPPILSDAKEDARQPGKRPCLISCLT